MNFSDNNISEGLIMPENIFSPTPTKPDPDQDFPLFEVISAVLLSYVFILLLGMQCKLLTKE